MQEHSHLLCEIGVDRNMLILGKKPRTIIDRPLHVQAQVTATVVQSPELVYGYWTHKQSSPSWDSSNAAAK